MTRDEAIDTVRDAVEFLGPRPRESAQWVDVFQKLGMLKLDEPKTPLQRAFDALVQNGRSFADAEQCLLSLQEAALKVVEK